MTEWVSDMIKCRDAIASKYLKPSVDIISGAPDTSPYAQTGVSVWDVRRLRPQRGVTDQALERLLVIHDIERLNPVICDIFTIADISRWGQHFLLRFCNWGWWQLLLEEKSVWSLNSLLQSPALHPHRSFISFVLFQCFKQEQRTSDLRKTFKIF